MPPTRPTKPPLSKSERFTLDHLVRRGAQALTPEECNRLLTLWEHDKGNREQERRITGGALNANHQLRAQLRAAEHQTTRYRTAWHSARRRATS